MKSPKEKSRRDGNEWTGRLTGQLLKQSRDEEMDRDVTGPQAGTTASEGSREEFQLWGKWEAAPTVDQVDRPTLAVQAQLTPSSRRQPSREGANVHEFWIYYKDRGHFG